MSALRLPKKAGFKKKTYSLANSNSNFISENYLSVDKEGRRRDACTSCLTPVLNAKCKHNLRLIQGVTVTKILLSNSTPKRAYGVEYVNSEDKKLSRKKYMIASKEVIVSAGPFGSPRLLQLSGIGPPWVLRKAGVQVKIPLQVGQNIQGRVVVPINADYTGVPMEPSQSSKLVFSEKSRRLFQEGKGGVLGIPSSFALGKVNSLGYFAVNGNTFPDFVDKKVLNAGCNSNEHSYGTLRIQNASPFSALLVRLGVLENQTDLRAVMKCVNAMVDMFNNFPKKFNMSVSFPPGGKVTEAFVREEGLWNGHFTGGCPVGKVLRGDLTVYKTKRLRVVDVSILKNMPISAGPATSLYMIAEYMAEVIAGVS